MVEPPEPRTVRDQPKTPQLHRILLRGVDDCIGKEYSSDLDSHFILSKGLSVDCLSTMAYRPFPLFAGLVGEHV